MKRKVLVLFVLFALLTACRSAQPIENQSPYSDLIAKYGITEKDQRTLAEFSYSVLDNYFEETTDLRDMTPTVFNDFDYDMIFITYLYQGKLRCSQGGGTNSTANRIYYDLINANVRCIEDERFDGVITADEYKDIEIVFNFMLNRRKVNYNDLDDLEKIIELGINAIEMETGGNRVYFKESVPISHNYSLEKTLQRLCVKAGQDEECYLDSDTDLYIYDSYTFKVNRQYEIVDLYRYNIYIDVDSITPDTILQSLGYAEQWFLNNLNPETGTLEYMYYPSDDVYSTDNNDIRQMACLFAMSELQKFLGNENLSDAISTTLDYYFNYMNDDYEVWIGSDAKIAYNAFLIMTLISFEDYPNRDEIMVGLGDAILRRQNDDGSFNTSFGSDVLSGVDFYPGESMLALMHLYNYTGENRYLEAVEKAFPYYRSYWRGNKNTAFVPWHSQTYLLLYQVNGDPDLPEFVFEMNDWMIRNYQIVETDYPDTLGGFTRALPRNSTSAYMEGMNDAYTLAVLTGNEEKQAEYLEAIRYAVRFILQMQYTPDNVFYLENPTRAIGGFRHSLVRNDQRNDYTQHATFALIKAYENGIFD